MVIIFGRISSVIEKVCKGMNGCWSLWIMEVGRLYKMGVFGLMVVSLGQDAFAI
jgi:hypothetical protein